MKELPGFPKTETIRCPKCKKVQPGQIHFEEWMPFPTYVHTCEACGYTIMESEWEKASYDEETKPSMSTMSSKEIANEIKRMFCIKYDLDPDDIDYIEHEKWDDYVDAFMQGFCICDISNFKEITSADTLEANRDRV